MKLDNDSLTVKDVAGNAVGNYVDGRALANFILDYCEIRDCVVTNLSLQKIVFFCHAWSLVETGHPLVKQDFEAWKYGPVLQHLYREFRQFDRRPIETRATAIDKKTGEKMTVPHPNKAGIVEFLEPVVSFYSRMPAGDLVELSHASGGPWDKAWNHHGTVNPGMRISNDDIRDYYSRIPPPFTTQ